MVKCIILWGLEINKYAHAAYVGIAFSRLRPNCAKPRLDTAGRSPPVTELMVPMAELMVLTAEPRVLSVP